MSERKKSNIIVAFSVDSFEKFFAPAEEIRRMSKYLQEVRPDRFDYKLMDKYFEFIDELKGYYDQKEVSY